MTLSFRAKLLASHVAVALAVGAVALLVMTEWAEFQHLPWSDLAKVVKRRTVFDARNFLPRQQLEEAGFTYIALGR